MSVLLTWRSLALIGLIIIVVAVIGIALAPLFQTDQQRAEREARAYLQRDADPGTLDHARVTSRRVDGRWLVVFEDANVPCDRLHWPDVCGMAIPPGPTPAPVTYRDIFACVDIATGRVGPVGASPKPLGQKNPCAAVPHTLGTPAPVATRAPASPTPSVSAPTAPRSSGRTVSDYAAMPWGPW